MTKQELDKQLEKRFKGTYFPKVAAELDGELVYLNELEVRYLQTLARAAAQVSEEAFQDFCKRNVVYSGPTKESSHHIMKFRESGKFFNMFEGHFFDACTRLFMEIL